MAIVSAGYEGDIDETAWAIILPMMGGRAYGVAGESDWKVTAGTADREVRIAPGVGFGHVILDRTTAESSLTLPAPVAGSVWHLIAVRRDWQNNQSVFGSIAGPTTTAAIPARNTTPGIADDQPIALVRVQAGQSQVVEIRDLRAWGGDGGVFAADELVKQYLDRIGTTIRIGDVQWQRTLTNLGSRAWSRTRLGDSGWLSVPPGDTSWSTDGGFGYSGLRARRIGHIVRIEGVAVRSATVLNGYVVGTVPPELRPAARVLISTQRDQIEASVQPSGAVVLNGQPIEGGLPIVFTGTWFID